MMSERIAYNPLLNESTVQESYPDPGTSQAASAPPPLAPEYVEPQTGAPPSYDSLYGELIDAQNKAKGQGDFLKNVWSIITGTYGCTIFLVFLLLIPIAMIVIGAINLHKCPMQRYIPIWLVVGGTVVAFWQLIAIYRQVRKNYFGKDDDDEDETESNATFACFNTILTCFCIAWLLAGSVWVFSNYIPGTSPEDISTYCNSVTYFFSFTILTLIFASLPIICCCSCCIAIYYKGVQSVTNSS